MKSKIFVFLFSLLIVPALISVTSCGKKDGADANTINIGALSDETGATSDVGKDYALGIQDAVAYVNDNSATMLNGKKIKLHQYDYGYKIPEALTKYDLFKQLKCIAILGWGTGDTKALAPKVTADKIPYVSASYSAHLTDPKKTPYNFFIATDYSSQVRGLITAWYDKVWKLKKKAGKPRIIFAYMHKSPFSSAAIKAGKDQATLLGFDIGPDADISLKEIDSKSKILSMKAFKPDVVVHTNTVNSVAVTIRDAYQLKLGADHLIKNWGFDENLPRLAGKEAAEGVYGSAPWAFFGDNVQLMDKVKEYAAKNTKAQLKDRTIHTVQAWANVLALAEAIKRADAAKELNGPGIVKKGFETFKDVQFGLGIAPVSYSPGDHRPQTEAKIYQYKNGKFSPFDSVDLKKKWADKWAKEWLGW